MPLPYDVYSMLLLYDACSIPSPVVYAVNCLQCVLYTPDDVCTMPLPL